ncbi:MAG: hypothetical protein V1886_02965 [archaeon]
MLDVCVVVDVEGFISFRQGNPSWNLWQKFKGKINNLIKGIRYDKNGFEKIYKLTIKKKFPCSFMLVGSLFKPKHNAPRFIDFGYHTLNHKPLTLISDSEMHREIKNISGAKSFSAPMWMIEDAKEPGRIFRALRKEKYKIAVYRGKNDKHESQISKPIIKYGIKCVYTSNWFDGERDFKVMEILNEIVQNSGKNAVYCITTHDFSNKKMKNFQVLISKLKEMEKKGIIKIKNLSQL